jgi:arylsulfatase A-like enzyme
MIVTYPSAFEKNIVSDSVVSTMDILPTICKLTGTSIPDGLDGVDITPLLTGACRVLNPRSLFWDTKAEEAIRKGKWKLLITRKVPNSRLQIVDTPKGMFLYDLERDPGETIDRSSEYPEIVKELSYALDDWQTSVTRNRQAKHNKPDAGDGK